MSNQETSSLQEYLDPDSFQRVADVRRQVWTGGFRGGAFGIVTGLLAHRLCVSKNLFGINRKHLIPFIAGFGAISAFVGSFAYGTTAFEHFGMDKGTNLVFFLSLF
jgi:hypothetical protein